MGKHDKKTKGGVSDHTVSRMRHQYKSPLHPGEIREILRRAKNFSGEENGSFTIPKEIIEELKAQPPEGKGLLGLVQNGIIRTVEEYAA